MVSMPTLYHDWAADKARGAELLETLASLGQAGEEEGRYGAV